MAKPDRALRENRLETREPAKLKAALPHASRVPKENNLEPKEPAKLKVALPQGNRIPKVSSPDRRELPRSTRNRGRIAAKKQESTRPAVPRSGLRENKLRLEIGLGAHWKCGNCWDKSIAS
jgi:hypothetical protein